MHLRRQSHGWTERKQEKRTSGCQERRTAERPHKMIPVRETLILMTSTESSVDGS